jgi:type II secretory pathway pseudopilin PulG
MTARGFTLIELLIATAVVMAVTGALAAMVAPLGTAIDRAHANADMDAGTRTAIQQLSADLRLAGSDAAIALPKARLARVLAPVALLRDLESGEVALPATALRATFVPHLAAQGALSAAAAAGDSLLRLDTTSRCATGLPSCGFRSRQSALLYTSDGVSAVSIAATDNGTVTLDSPLTTPFPAGAVLTEFVSVTYGTRPLADGSQRLVRISTGGAEQPLLDNVVAFSVATDTGQPLDAARLSWSLRVQAPSTAFRGPAGFLFRRAGTATRARDWIADVEHRMVVAVRNREAVW